MGLIRGGLFRVAAVAGSFLITSCALLRDYSIPEESESHAEPVENRLARGDSAYEREDYAEAVVFYRESARAGQQEAVAWFNAANALVRLDRTAEAAEAYRRSVRAAPGFLKAHQNLAALYQIAGDVPGARDTAAALLWMERYNARAAAEGRAVPWALMLHADLAVASGRSEQGLALYREAAAASPEDARPWLRMARILRDGGRPLEAASALRQGLEAAPTRGELWAARGALLFEGGDPLGARAAFARAYRLGSAEGLQGLEMLADWHERRLEPAAAAAVRDTLGFK